MKFTMTSSDLLTLIVSMLAMLISAISAVIAYRQAKSEAREQLNELIQELVKTEPDGSNMQKIAFLARQAAELIESEPGMATDVDYSVAAGAFAYLGDLPRAGDYWPKAVERSPSDFYRVVNQRGYASFLFWQGKQEQARKVYQEALEIFDSASDFNKYTNGFTYQMWFISEALNVPQEYSGAENYYKNARALFESISSPQRRSQAIQALEDFKFKLWSPGSASQPAFPGQTPNATTSPLEGMGTSLNKNQ